MIGQLTNHLWQSTFFALVAALLTLAFRGNRAKIRYSLWLTASLKFLVPFALLIGLGSQLQWTPAAQRIAARAPSANVLSTIEQFSEPFVSDVPVALRSQPHMDWWRNALIATWLCGFVAVALLRLRAWRSVRSAVRRSLPLALALPVEARLSSGILEPGVVGFWRPVLLLPQGIIDRLTSSELETVIAHELCHVRRRDNLFASIQMLVEALFWFHPLVWWIGARLVAERERACDEDVVSLGNRREVYADAILNVCKLYAESPLACVSGVTGADIRRRIEAIMSNKGVSGLNLAKKTLLAFAGTVAVTGPVVTGLLISIGHVLPLMAQLPAPNPVATQPILVARQEPVAAPKPTEPPQTPKPAPKFDAASIRPCSPDDRGGRGSGKIGSAPPSDDGTGGYFARSPGRLNITCGGILTMIGIAYDTYDKPLLNVSHGLRSESEHIRGVPQWAMSPRYTIEAVTSDPIANGPTDTLKSPAFRIMTGPMLRSLLEDRFQLKLHRLTEDVPMYALKVAKSGLKLRPIQDGDCTELERGRGMKRLGPNDKPYCGWMGWDVDGPNRVVLGGGVPLSRLVEILSDEVMDRRVLDQTGIAEKFNLRLVYSPDERTRCLGPADMCVVDPSSQIPPGPDIFTALEQQFGLRLESIRGPHESIVIDHVERPSEN